MACVQGPRDHVQRSYLTHGQHWETSQCVPAELFPQAVTLLLHGLIHGCSHDTSLKPLLCRVSCSWVALSLATADMSTDCSNNTSALTLSPCGSITIFDRGTELTESPLSKCVCVCNLWSHKVPGGMCFVAVWSFMQGVAAETRVCHQRRHSHFPGDTRPSVPASNTMTPVVRPDPGCFAGFSGAVKC